MLLTIEKNHHYDEYISNSSKLNSRIKGHSNAFGTICRILVTISWCECWPYNFEIVSIMEGSVVKSKIIIPTIHDAIYIKRFFNRLNRTLEFLSVYFSSSILKRC